MSIEKRLTAQSGWSMLGVNLAALLASIAAFVGTCILGKTVAQGFLLLLIVVIPAIAVSIILLCGHFTLEPNEARAMLLFGDYHGTVRDSGFFGPIRSTRSRGSRCGHATWRRRNSR